MKFTLTFKSPDALDQVLNSCPKCEEHPLYVEDCSDCANEDIREDIREAAGKFVEYGEYITVEFDTNTGTAKVLPLNRKI